MSNARGPCGTFYIFTAVQAEAKAIRKTLPGECELQVIGVRAVQLPTTLTAARGIIMAGFGGALDPALRIGDVVIDDGNGQIHTTHAIVATPAEKATVFAKTGAKVVDMENSIVRDFAARLGVPFIGIRAVSDTANETLDPAILGFVDELGRVRPGALAAGLLRQPSLIPQLRRLAANSKRAGEQLALAVQRIAACGFADEKRNDQVI